MKYEWIFNFCSRFKFNFFAFILSFNLQSKHKHFGFRDFMFFRFFVAVFFWSLNFIFKSNFCFWMHFITCNEYKSNHYRHYTLQTIMHYVCSFIFLYFWKIAPKTIITHFLSNSKFKCILNHFLHICPSIVSTFPLSLSIVSQFQNETLGTRGLYEKNVIEGVVCAISSVHSLYMHVYSSKFLKFATYFLDFSKF